MKNSRMYLLTLWRTKIKIASGYGDCCYKKCDHYSLSILKICNHWLQLPTEIDKNSDRNLGMSCLKSHCRRKHAKDFLIWIKITPNLLWYFFHFPNKEGFKTYNMFMVCKISINFSVKRCTQIKLNLDKLTEEVLWRRLCC